MTIRQQKLIENYIRKVVRKSLNERKIKLSEVYSIQNLEQDFYKNKASILKRMKEYGFNSNSVKNIKNYYDLATILGIDSRELKNVELKVYAETLYSLLTGR